ncbi:hypothetical protein PsorP6_014337 [Peronosclerospora sorghi]|uniref:Uncharacterized protein n=1 Tax=Peronosclerospora sorghi TaxID=230839 RepID=A0ACC0VFG1_9STRA|nr:hypothetical protein PsorP6_014337 [Peronosclerospora sorghi]
MMFKLFQMMQQHNLHLQTQLQAFMKQTQIQFKQMLTRQGPGRKKDPPTTWCCLSIFSTGYEYWYKHDLMHADYLSLWKRPNQNSESLCRTGIVLSCEPECAAAAVNKMWRLFKEKIRQRFKPRDFEYSLRDPLFELKQTSSIHEYVVKFQDLHLYPLRILINSKHDSETIKIATNFEFAHYTGTPRRKKGQKNNSRPKKDSLQSLTNKKDKKNGQNSPLSKNYYWNKHTTCHICKQNGHISPNCPQKKESNNYISGAFYAIIEVQALAYCEPENKKNVSIFLDNGCLNRIPEELAEALNLSVHEDVNNTIEVDLGFGQTARRSRPTAEMILVVLAFQQESPRSR